MGLRMDASWGSSGDLSSLDRPSGAPPLGASGLTTCHPRVSPLEMQILERDAHQAGMCPGPNPMVRDTGMVTGHLPEATQSQESYASPSPDGGKDAEQLKPACGPYTLSVLSLFTFCSLSLEGSALLQALA